VHHKSRNISTYQFLVELQKEHFIAELRSKIHTKKEQKDKLRQIMKYKIEKIEDVSSRNSLPTIFTSDEVREKIRSLVFDIDNKPKFELFNEYDELKYYSRGNEFKILSEDKTGQIGISQDVLHEKRKIFLKLLDSETLVELEFAEVVRIL